ncbi:YdgA family protein [Pulveribacter suum]|uniref:DUF945 domain-containing protein n=1 Tax=Pulveribacter suum TaxID=2116657 RepID=A0A2P1NKP5_9BURK|nr:DUF945 family protein [Pulveribacter suum]AVP57634.1 DUF945 domain-containing protein [Pulveribacter suum]
MQRQKTLVALAAAAVVAGAAYGAATWYSGRQVQTAYQQAIAELRTAIGPQAIITDEYRKGFFSAQAHLVLEWTPPAALADEPQEDDDEEDGERPAAAPAAPAAPAQPLRLVVDSDVRHGPLAGARLAAAVVQTRFSLQGLSESAQKALAQVQGPQLTAVRHYSGASDLRLQLPAGEIVDEETALRWQALAYDMHLGRDGRRISGSFQWPGWTLVGPAGSGDEDEDALADAEDAQDADSAASAASAAATAADAAAAAVAASEDAAPRPTRLFTVAATGMQGSFDSTMIEGLWGMGPGTLQLRVAQLQASSAPIKGGAAKPLLDLKDLHAQTEVVSDNATVGYSNRIKAVGSIGPLQFEALSMHEQVQRLDIEALRGMLRHMGQSYRTALRASDVGEMEDALQEQQTELLQQAAPRLVAALPSYQMKLEATYQGQTGHVTYGAEIKQAPTPAQMAEGGWLPALMQGGALNASLRLPKAWLSPLLQAGGKPAMDDDELQGMLAMAQAVGYVRTEGEQIASDLALQGGQWTLNGRTVASPLDLPD